ncbi:MAG: hypothetical protein KGL11_04540 [Alphaproteobacteria bacterium]|nr:hypothetical protein [Alphaproteobacteria bacterium]
MMLRRLWLFVAIAFALGGCGVVAAPCRVSSGLLKAVPLVGHVAATPTDTCADVIDPDSISRS